MKRNYSNNDVREDVQFFVGTEIERTPAYGMKTLFVVGVHNEQVVTDLAKNNDCKHIFFGANHSFNPKYDDYQDWKSWEDMIEYCLDQGFWCSLDIPLSAVEQFNDGGLNEYNQFIPQIRVPIPYTKLWNYNTMLKIDDKGFNATNPGVWTHSLHDLMDRNAFTDWTQYNQDEIIK
jgi:hypothetical protein